MNPRLVIAALLAPVLLAASARALDLRGEFERRLDEGANAYDDARYDDALTAFRDAAVIRPGSYEAAVNVGLAHARLGNTAAAAAQFSSAAELAAGDSRRRAWALYNRGRAEYDEASAGAAKLLAEGSHPTAGADPRALIEVAARSIASFDQALAANPHNEFARYNRAQAQHLIQKLAHLLQRPPEDQQQASDRQRGDSQQEEDSRNQNEAGENNEESRHNQGDDQQAGQPQSSSQSQDTGPPPPDSEGQPNLQAESSGTDQEKPAAPKADNPQPREQDAPEGGASETNSEQTTGQASGETQAAAATQRMSEKEARALLNLLGSDDILFLRLPRSPRTPPPQKDW